MGIYKYKEEDLYNGIVSIDGYYRINHSDAHNYNNEFAVRIDSSITPIFCSMCNKQVPGFYKLNGSRYGQVGEVECERCHSIIYITDTDNFVDKLYNSVKNYRNPFITNVKKFDTIMATYTFNYSKLYFLDGNIFNRIEEVSGFSLLKEYETWVDLADVILSICKKINCNISCFKNTKYFSDSHVTDLPVVIHTWFSLLVHLGILYEKENLCYISSK